MNRLLPALVHGVTLLLAPNISTFGQSRWETVDALVPMRGRDIVADADGSFISLAIDNVTSNVGPVATAVRFSHDQGLTWQTVGLINGYANDLAAGPGGALFAAGNRSANVSGRAFLWQSLDHGSTWIVSDPSTGSPGAFLVLDVAAGNSGDIYLCGYFMSGGSCIIRKGHPTANGSFTWSTVDSSSLGQPQSIMVRPGAAGRPDEVLYVSGNWTVRRSLDSGATWMTIGVPSTGSYSTQQAYALAVAADGAIYVAGRVGKTVGTKKTGYSNEYGQLVRRSGNGGASWQDVDYVSNVTPAYSSGVIVDAFGRVLVAGYGTTTPNTWLVRGSSDSGATWMTTDSFQPAGTNRDLPMGIAADGRGNICVSGEIGDTVSTYTAIIRRLAAP